MRKDLREGRLALAVMGGTIRERHGYWLPTMGCGYGYLWVWIRVGTRVPIPTTHGFTHGLFDFITSTVLYVRRGWEWMWKRKRMMEKGEREEGDDENEWKRGRRGWKRERE